MQLQYYLIILSSVIGLAAAFVLTKVYQNLTNTALRVSVLYNIMAGLCTALVFFCFNGFHFSITPFSLGMAVIMTLCSGTYVILGFKLISMGHISTYTLFLMLGGMMLPFFAGVLLFDERLTAGSVICFVLVLISLLFTVKRGNGGSYLIYYAGIFLLNGMSGVLSKWFAAAPYEKTSSAGYSILSAAVAAALSAIVLLFIRGDRLKLSVRGATNMLGYGVLNKIGNFLLLIALAHLPASVQYPMVTGGVMICSTVICFFTHQKPGKREIASLVLSFVGILALVLL